MPPNWRHWLEPRPGPKRQKQGAFRLEVPPGFELGSLDSESRVLTITPWNPTAMLWLCNSWNLLLYDNAYLFACVNVVNSWKSLAAFLSILSHGRVGGVVASIAAFQAVDLGSIPGRRKEVSGGLHFIQGDLVTPLIDVISPRFVAKPFSSQQWLLNPANIF